MGKLEDLEARIALLENISGLDRAKQLVLETLSESRIEVMRRADETHAIAYAIFEILDYLGLHDSTVERVLKNAGLTRKQHGRR